jgi:hypothetical protein
MSYFAEVTHTECVNRMLSVKDSVQERTALELKVLSALDAAKEAYFAAGGKVDVRAAFEMQDPESEGAKQRRIDALRQYDLNHQRQAIRVSKRGK